MKAQKRGNQSFLCFREFSSTTLRTKTKLTAYFTNSEDRFGMEAISWACLGLSFWQTNEVKEEIKKAQRIDL